MKKFLIFFVISIIVVGCSVQKKPIFLKLDEVKFNSFKADTVKLQAKAFFKNENDIGGKISTDAINVLIDGIEIAKVSSEEFKVPANKEFSVPLKVEIPTAKIFKNQKNGLLGGLLNSLLSKKVKVQFKGDIKYKVLGFSSTYAVDKTQELKIKL